MTTLKNSVGARELKTRLGAYLRQVRDGATLIVTERGTPVAELRPIDLASLELEDALRELVTRGVLSGGIRERSRLTDFEPVSCAGPPASHAIRKDREDRF